MTDDRPSMKQVDHEDHNMPEPEHDGTEFKMSETSVGNAMLAKRATESGAARVMRNWKKQDQ